MLQVLSSLDGSSNLARQDVLDSRAPWGKRSSILRAVLRMGGELLCHLSVR